MDSNPLPPPGPAPPLPPATHGFFRANICSINKFYSYCRAEDYAGLDIIFCERNQINTTYGKDQGYAIPQGRSFYTGEYYREDQPSSTGTGNKTLLFGWSGVNNLDFVNMSANLFRIKETQPSLRLQTVEIEETKRLVSLRKDFTVPYGFCFRAEGLAQKNFSYKDLAVF